eukprot:scaffold781_cov394-Prasinococcus_capsulatus_cf.AAC.29
MKAALLRVVLALASLVALVAEEADPCEEWTRLENTEDKTRMWSLISQGEVSYIRSWVDTNPCVAKLRSEDGRGPLFWAYEFGRKEIVELMLASGADAEATDGDGRKPVEFLAGWREDYSHSVDEDDFEVRNTRFQHSSIP